LERVPCLEREGLRQSVREEGMVDPQRERREDAADLGVELLTGDAQLPAWARRPRRRPGVVVRQVSTLPGIASYLAMANALVPRRLIRGRGPGQYPETFRLNRTFVSNHSRQCQSTLMTHATGAELTRLVNMSAEAHRLNERHT
jgi:hypothetical protein